MTRARERIDLATVGERRTWDTLLAAVGYSPWQQSWGYGAAFARAGRPLVRLRLDADGATVGVVQATGRLTLGGRIGVWHALGGPLWRPGVDAATKAASLRALKGRLAGPARLFVATPAAAARRLGPAFADADMRRVMTGYTSAILPIAGEPEARLRRPRPSWRRELHRRRAGALDLACRDAAADPLALADAVARHEDARRRRGYAAVPARLVTAAARTGPALLATARADDALVACMLFFVHGVTATYQLGWTDAVGRGASAHHRLLWATLPVLHARGARLLDLGGLNVPDGIARFKLASGALPRTFAGSYL